MKFKNTYFFLCLLGIVTFAFKKETNTDSNAAKIELGHYLFFEKKLSANGTKSCSSCHDPKFAFSDGYRKPLGIYADELPHNTPSLLNVAQFHTLNWANPTLHDLETQMLRPLFNQQPIEMGNTLANEGVLLELSKNKMYNELYSKVFGKEDNPFTWKNTIAAIAAYIRTLTSQNAKYDEVLAHKSQFTDSEAEGKSLFFSKKAKCSVCHQGVFFTNQKFYKSLINKEKIRTPSLRNVALTAPYMHDGSVATLREALQMCQKYRSCQTFSDDEQYKLLLFLDTLTDSTIFKNPLFQEIKH
jgi:cytochrome c peroxidase